MSLLARALFLAIAATGVAWLVLQGINGASALAFMLVGLPALLLRLPQEQRPPTELSAWHGLAILVGIAALALGIWAYVYVFDHSGLWYSSLSAPPGLAKWLLALGVWALVMSSTIHRVRRLAFKPPA